MEGGVENLPPVLKRDQKGLKVTKIQLPPPKHLSTMVKNILGLSCQIGSRNRVNCPWIMTQKQTVVFHKQCWLVSPRL